MLTFLLLFLLLFIHISGVTAADEATSITLSYELSISEHLPGGELWINGSAIYDNGSPVAEAEVLIELTDNSMEWTTITDISGNYHAPIAAMGRFIDQSQPVASEIFGYTDMIRSVKRVGQSFIPNASEIQSIDIYLVKSFPAPFSSFTVHIKPDQNASDVGNCTLVYDDISNGWNNFVFPQPLDVVAGDEYFILLTSNTTTGGYANYGGPWDWQSDYYENGTVYWDYGTYLESDPYQDIGFFIYYEEPLIPGEYRINVSITGANSTQELYGYNETILKVILADIQVTEENLTLSHDNDPILEGDAVTINMSLQNIGDAPASNFLVNFSLDSEENVFDSITVSLNPFSEDILSSIWTAEAGNHTMIVTADATNVVMENQETNNKVMIQLFVDGDNDGDGVGNISDRDDDNDGYTDAIEVIYKTDPLSDLSTPPDNDHDFIPDLHDADDDNDGYSDDIEVQVGTDPLSNASIPEDFDSDGIPDSLDKDIDNDGILNADDAFPYNLAEWRDLDLDGIGDNADLDDDSDGYLDDEDAYPLDTDNDGLDNDVDWDDDADGVPDIEDARPLDTDNDGLRNDADADDDGDGLSDEEESRKHTNPLKQDTDGDGVGDKADYDPLDSGVTSEQGLQMIYLLVPVITIVILVLLAFVSSRGFTLRPSSRLGGEYKELPELGVEYEVPAEPEPAKKRVPPPSPGITQVPTSEELTKHEEEFDELADIEEEFEEISTKSKGEEKQ